MLEKYSTVYNSLLWLLSLTDSLLLLNTCGFFNGARVQVCAHVHAYVRVCVRAHVHAREQVHMHLFVRSYVHMLVCVLMCARACSWLLYM